MDFAPPQFDQIPLELREIPRWMIWRAEVSRPGEKARKVPYCPVRPGSRASSTDPNTWGTFKQAQAAYAEGGYTGVGIVLNGDGLVGVDIDNCVIDGKPSEQSLELLNTLGASYIEISPSGAGLRAIGYGEQLVTGVNGSRDGLKAEFYSTGRYLTLTGRIIKADPITPFLNFKAVAESFRVAKKEKVNQVTGEIKPTTSDERHASLVMAIFSGDVYHDSLRDLAASLTATGMHAGAAINHLRGLMDASIGPHDDRWKSRRAQIPDLVNSAVQKFVPTESVGGEHVLAKFMDCDLAPRPPRWTIPGFVGHGVTIIAGAHGVGKTSTILPLSMVAAGLHCKGDLLAPMHWRHVVYIVEDFEQAARILAGMVGWSNLELDKDLVRKRLHIVEAKRLDPLYVAQVGRVYCEKFTRIVDGVSILPLVVIDTKAAVLALENENDNAEASKAMAALKQGFEGLPVWLVGHVAKQNVGRSELEGLSLRGGSAFEADANQVLYLVKENDKRYLVRGKTRFEAKWRELEIVTHCAQTTANDEFGADELVSMRWNTAVPAMQTRKELEELNKSQATQDDAVALKNAVREAVQSAWLIGNPINREGVKARVKRNRQLVAGVIEDLLAEQWLYEVTVPPKDRTNPKRSTYLVAFDAVERELFLRDGVPQQDKMVVPRSWRKGGPQFNSPPETNEQKNVYLEGRKDVQNA